MYWDDEEKSEQQITTSSVDLVFGLSCRCLPVDHAYQLSQSVQAILPWFPDEEAAGLHTIHVANSANGWVRPEQPDALLHPSRRTKFTLRVPEHRIDDAKKLQGKTLDVGGGYQAQVKQASVRKLSVLPTVYARYIETDGDSDETIVLESMVQQLNDMKIRPKKMLCGIQTFIMTPDGPVTTRSLMIAELSPDQAIAIQQQGLGAKRWLGCGVFIAYKDIGQISDDLG
jgi:CRISPR-associated protein Cas6